MKTTWKIGPIEADKVTWIVMAFVLLVAVSALGTMIARADKPVAFRAVSGVVSLKGPVAIEEKNVKGEVRRVDLIADKSKKVKEIHVVVKDSKGKVLSEIKAKGRS